MDRAQMEGFITNYYEYHFLYVNGIEHVESRNIVTSPAEKRDLFAGTGALAVDMEQRIVRDMLAPLGGSVLRIRAISDAADTSLDPALPGLVDPIGGPKWPALAGAVLRRPALSSRSFVSEGIRRAPAGS